jgi:hypothetical protein
MKKIELSLILLLPALQALCQNWNGTTTPTTTTDWNTSIQLTNTGWGSHQGLLFNAYRGTLGDGPLTAPGNTKHSFDVGPYSSGAGGIFYLGNGGRMDFMISDNSTGANTNVDWGASKMSLYRNGKVSIGTSNTFGQVTIAGDYGIAVEPSTSSTQYFYIASNSADNIIGVNARTKIGAWEIPDPSKPSSFLDFSTYNNPASAYYGGIAFFTRASGASGIGTEKVTILNNGNVGIGTTDTKGYKLAIAGKAIAEEIVVKLQSAWPDYVFENSYTLTSLTQLEQYIQKNKHLPDVPSVEEVKTNGISVGEMNVILLKKLEELTLHLIEQQKEIENLKSIINK